MPGIQGWIKKAPRVGAFFVLALWLAPAAADSCAVPSGTEQVKIRYVTDGDTVILADERRVRLIGINTPELGRDDKPTQALAIRARDRLRQLLFQHGNRAQLSYGKNRKDRYGRTLANLWSPDGKNLGAKLLREGLGWMIAIPPNIKFLACYREAEQSARKASTGVWQHPDYKVKQTRELGLRTSGFQRVQGRILRVNHGGGATWINLEGRFAVRIPDADIKYFSKQPKSDWVGRILEVQGWAFNTRGEMRVNVHHPAMLRFVN